MDLKQDIQKLEPGQLIDLFILDLTPIGQQVVYYFYAGVDANYGPLQFDTKTYQPWPLVVEGINKTGTGPLPRPLFTISNVTGFVSSILPLYEDLAGAHVTRVRTFAKYLDNGPSPDPNAKVIERYIIEQKKVENKEVVQFELASGLDIENRKLPGRVLVANTCTWIYKSAECSWPGTDPSKWFDADGNPVTDQNLDSCGKRLSDCKLRFGNSAELPFGGAPGMGKV